MYYSVAGAGIVLLAWVLAGSIVDLVGIPQDMHVQARWLLVGSTAVLACGQGLGVGESLLIGLQRMDVSSGIVLAGSVLDIVATVGVLSLGYGLPGLVVKDGLLTALLGAVRLIMLYRLQPGVTLRLGLANADILHELLSFGLRIQVTRLAELTATHVDKLLLGHFVGLQVVAQYELASRVVRLVKYLTLSVTSALMPAATVLQTLGERSKMLSLYYRLSKYLVLVAAPSTLFLIVMAPAILFAWVGPGYGQAALLLQALAAGHVAHTLTSAGTTIVRATGQPEYESRYTVILLLAGLMLGLGLIGAFGYAGAVVATPLALIISSACFFAIFHRLFGASFRRLLRVYTLPSAASAILASVLWLLTTTRGWPAADAGRWQQLGWLVAAFAVFSVAYAAILWHRGYLDSLDRTLMLRYLPERLRHSQRETGA